MHTIMCTTSSTSSTSRRTARFSFVNLSFVHKTDACAHGAWYYDCCMRKLVSRFTYNMMYM